MDEYKWYTINTYIRSEIVHVSGGDKDIIKDLILDAEEKIKENPNNLSKSRLKALKARLEELESE